MSPSAGTEDAAAQALLQGSALPRLAPEVSAAVPRHAPKPVGGRLRHFLPAWRKLTVDPWVLRTVSAGLRLEWKFPPPRDRTCPTRMHHLTMQDVGLVDSEVASMLDKGAIYNVEDKRAFSGFESPLFMTAKKDGGHRPVFNLKDLNAYVEVPHFKMEGLHMLPDLLQEGDYMAKLDLKDAYFSVPVCSEHQRYLQFAWKGRRYRFKVLPFGLAPGPVIFTKVLKPVLAFLRRQGIRLIQYLDDCLVIGSTAAECRANLALAVDLLQSLGFVVNWKKSIVTPVQQIGFLGVVIDSVLLQLTLPEAKVHQIRRSCRKWLRHATMSTLSLSQLIGLLNSTRQAVLAAPLHLRALQSCLAERVRHCSDYSQYSYVVLSPAARAELLWWAESLPHWNYRRIRATAPALRITTDASTTGWGAVCHAERVRTAHGQWTAEETAEHHINALELMTAMFALRCFASDRQGIHVQLEMDNSSSIAYINNMGGNHSLALNEIACTIWTWCLKRRIVPSAVHIPGRLNTEADSLSRMGKDCSDWMLDPACFAAIHRRFLVEIDLFASRTNAQMSRYCSYQPDPFAEAIDALAIPWQGLQGYAFPPFILIGRCLQKIQQEEVDLLTLVAPCWPAQTWYPVLLQALCAPPRLLPQHPALLQDATGNLHPLRLQQSLPLAVWPVSGKPSKIKAFHSQLPNSSWPPGGWAQNERTRQDGDNGVAGVIRGKLIHFQPL